MNHSESQVLVVAVDLASLRLGGANGGVAPAVFSLLAEAGRQKGDSLSFLFLTNSASHEEVRRLARPHDLLVCVQEDPAFPLRLRAASGSGEFKFLSPPADFLARVGADVLYCPFAGSAFHAGNIPMVALIPDMLHRDFPLALPGAQGTEREACIEQALKAASMVQCVSRSGMERLLAHYPLAVENLFCTYLPAQERLERPDTNGAKLTLKLDFVAPFFFYPADLRKHKNHETLLLAYRLYRERAGDGAWDLVLTFPEDKRAREIKELLEVLGIADHVHLPGYVTDAGLRALWQRAGALVFPSLHEGFGLPLVEAMYYGVPILAASDLSIKEIAGEAFHPMDPRKLESIAEALLKVSRDAALRASLVCEGKTRLAFFDLETETRKLVDVWMALSRRVGNFPRRARVLEQPCVLAVSTPASDELWRVEVRVDPQFPQNRYAVYLDDCAYGAYSPALPQEDCFRFECRPKARTLRVAVSRDRRVPGNDAPVVEGAIHEIAARSQEGQSIALFKKREAARV